MKNSHRGSIVLPVAGGLALVLAALGVTWWLSQTRISLPPAANSGANPSPAETPTRKGRLIWEAGFSGALIQALHPGENIIQTIVLGEEMTVVKIIAENEAVRVTLKDGAGEEIKKNDPKQPRVTETRITDPLTGRLAILYRINQAADAAPGENLQINLTNLNPASAVNYSVTVSNQAVSVAPPPPATVIHTVGNQTVILSIAVTETIALNVTVPVLGADVLAIITSPSGQNYTVNLVENTSDAPGTYTGSFSGITETGTYQVTYVISGENADGQSFDQTVQDQFTVTATDLQLGSGSGPGYQSTKVFDINQENEVRVRQGGEY